MKLVMQTRYIEEGVPTGSCSYGEHIATVAGMKLFPLSTRFFLNELVCTNQCFNRYFPY